ncbi:DUF397 domain-containing protein [Streptomyces sp. DW26H14]|uniref:DUF397 domain-containing protein n=1 Tax=Streptomyces sp. DW26H14 TaxID=3435395 RepID=UPI00403DB401
MNVREATWMKSSYSNGNGGDCVEWAPAVAASDGVVPVRDSKAPGTGVLVFPRGSWTRFVAATGEGGFPGRANPAMTGHASEPGTGERSHSVKASETRLVDG